MTIEESEQQPVKVYVTYENRETGEQKEFLSPNYPYDDSLWMSQWCFVSSRTEDHNKPQHTLIIVNEEGENITSTIINNHTINVMAISYDFTSTDTSFASYFESLFTMSEERGWHFMLLVASNNPRQDIEHYRALTKADYDIYQVDDVELKMMVRSNPGLLLLKNGTVVKKWSWRDFPKSEEIEKILNH